MKLYRFQVYNSIMNHLYIALCIYHPKSRLLLSSMYVSIYLSIYLSSMYHLSSIYHLSIYHLSVSSLLYYFLPPPKTFATSLPSLSCDDTTFTNLNTHDHFYHVVCSMTSKALEVRVYM